MLRLRHKVIMAAGVAYAAFVVWVFATDADVKFLCRHGIVEHGCQAQE